MPAGAFPGHAVAEHAKTGPTNAATFRLRQPTDLAFAGRGLTILSLYAAMDFRYLPWPLVRCADH